MQITKKRLEEDAWFLSLVQKPTLQAALGLQHSPVYLRLSAGAPWAQTQTPSRRPMNVQANDRHLYREFRGAQSANGEPSFRFDPEAELAQNHLRSWSGVGQERVSWEAGRQEQERNQD
jgi:hypothetical protein